MEYFGSHWTGIFMKFDNWVFFEYLTRKFKIHCNRKRITCALHEDQFTFLTHRRHFYLEWELFQTKVIKKIKTQILCSVTFFENRTVYEIIWKNRLKPERSQMKYGACAFHAEYLKLQTHTPGIANIYCFSIAKIVHFNCVHIIIILIIIIIIINLQTKCTHCLLLRPTA